MDATRLEGALTALVTPFDDREDVDIGQLTRLVNAQIDHGIDGLVACGTTGETPTLAADEQDLVIRTVVEAAAGRVPVIAGTGTNDTRQTAARTKYAASLGVDAALVVCPYYNKPTQEGLYQHFRAVHEASGLAIIAYNVPGRTVSDLMPETVGRLVADGIIAGVKDATANLQRATETLTCVGDRPFALLSGDDFTILPFCAVGGRGVISVVSNVAPGDTSKLVALSRAGKLAEAQVLHARIVALSKALFLTANPIPVKAAMALAGWCRPSLRLPLIAADAGLTTQLSAAMHAYRGEAGTLDGYMA